MPHPDPSPNLLPADTQIRCPDCGTGTWVRRRTTRRTEELSLYLGAAQPLRSADRAWDEIETTEAWFCGACQRPASVEAAAQLEAVVLESRPLEDPPLA
jgi:hypothetical protein